MLGHCLTSCVIVLNGVDQAKKSSSPSSIQVYQLILYHCTRRRCFQPYNQLSFFWKQQGQGGGDSSGKHEEGRNWQWMCWLKKHVIGMQHLYFSGNPFLKQCCTYKDCSQIPLFSMTTIFVSTSHRVASEKKKEMFYNTSTVVHNI